ncbi:unnamed protein product, partial [Ostreobium quekettii]
MRPLVQAEPPRQAQSDRPSASPAYRPSVEDGAPESSLAATIDEMFDRSVAACGGQPMLGLRAGPASAPGGYAFSTYSEVSLRVSAFARALNGIQGSGLPVAIYGQNSPEWMVAFLACARAGRVVVPINDSLGARQAEYVLRHCEAGAMVVSSGHLARALSLASRVKSVRTIVHWSAPAGAPYPLPPGVSEATSAGVEVVSLEALCRGGADAPGPSLGPRPSPDDVLAVMYTSGTTGAQKGVMLTHRAVMSTMAGIEDICRLAGTDMGPGDSILSYLPLAHILELETELFFVFVGGAIGYWRGDPGGLLEDVQALRPTMFLGVPHIFDRMVARLKSRVAHLDFPRRSAFGVGYRWKLALLRRQRRGVFGKAVVGTLNLLLFRKACRKMLGGRTKLVLSGGAPLSSSSEEFLRVGVCCPIVQGYGLTETCGGVFASMPHRFEMFGTVGVPLRSTTFRLESVPELGYDALADPPCGELLIKSPQLFSGYYKAPDASNVDKDGWLHTGDIAQLEDGYIRIMDRRHNFTLNSDGDFLSLEKIEAAYRNCSIVDQIWIYCVAPRQVLVAVVVPHPEGIEAWAKTAKV